jgi:hypothetical protein
MKTWLVNYRVTHEGSASVEAETADEAFDMVDGGNFDADPGQEMVDWEAYGHPKEDA